MKTLLIGNFNMTIENINNLEDILKAFKSHPSIAKIKKAIFTTEKFSFRNVKDDEVRKFIMNLDGSTAIPVEIYLLTC